MAVVADLAATPLQRGAILRASGDGIAAAGRTGTTTLDEAAAVVAVLQVESLGYDTCKALYALLPTVRTDPHLDRQGEPVGT